MSARSDVLLWAQRIVGRRSATAHQLLEIAPDATIEVAQEAFHKIARLAHPDLHRSSLTPEELELVTTAYARAAAAYQELRTARLTARMRPIRTSGSDPALVPTQVIPTSAAPNKAVAVDPDAPPSNPGSGLTGKALIHYRKAELALRRGDLTAAILQLKMAIVSDPQSQFLRSALSEVEAEVAKQR